ncbi:hypothetical protein Poli38472_004953 [Pythium oligandrum]|uniref:Uncharacterized protein n=1 Tax=Pythium oligandrum TaxID=41045 RepID=A0A8K1CB95_PYTOL|nr:hypothetical protein Poli38472_004953 [Pythium oligandrum]|eukprot:TMW59884.1 hypothetical protein Poli38472_004953 [Pythium oligandrum]
MEGSDTALLREALAIFDRIEGEQDLFYAEAASTVSSSKQDDSQTSSDASKTNAKSSLGRMKVEIRQLRDHVRDLERILEEMKANEAIRSNPVNEKRCLEVMWEAMALRQKRSVKRAELENSRLRHKVQHQFLAAHHFLTSVQRGTTLMSSSDLDNAFSSRQLEVGIRPEDLYHNTSAGFSAPYFLDGSNIFNHANVQEGEMATTVEIHDSWVVPFSLQAADNAVWTFLSQRIYWEDSYYDLATESTDHSVNLRFRAHENAEYLFLGGFEGDIKIHRFPSEDGQSSIITLLFLATPVTWTRHPVLGTVVYEVGWVRVQDAGSGQSTPLTRIQSSRRMHIDCGAVEPSQRRQALQTVAEYALVDMKTEFIYRQDMIENILNAGDASPLKVGLKSRFALMERSDAALLREALAIFDRINGESDLFYDEAASAVASAEQDDSQTNNDASKTNAKSSLGRMKDEIRQLRDHVRDLERILEEMKANEAIRSNPVDEKRCLEVMWEAMALRQKRSVKRAELENSRLRHKVQRQFLAAHHFLTSVQRGTTLMSSSDLDNALSRRQVEVGIRPEDLYHNTSAGFSAPYFVDGSNIFNHVNVQEGEMSTTIEIHDSWVVPFSLQAADNAVWTFLSQRIYWEDTYYNLTSELTERSVRLKFRAHENAEYLFLGAFEGDLNIHRFPADDGQSNIAVLTFVTTPVAWTSLPVAGTVVYQVAWARVQDASTGQSNALTRIQCSRRMHIDCGAVEPSRRHQALQTVAANALVEFTPEFIFRQDMIENILVRTQAATSV